MMTPKPKIQIATGNIEMSSIKFEGDQEMSFKRKREPDDYDSMDN